MGSKLNAFWNIYSSKYFPVAIHTVAQWCEIPGSENPSHIKALWRCTATKTGGSSDPGRGFARGTPTSIDPVFFHDTERQTDDGMAISDLITSPPVLPWPSITKIMGWPKSLSGASRHDISRGGGELRKLQPRPLGLVSVEAANKGIRARSRPIYFYRGGGRSESKSLFQI